MELDVAGKRDRLGWSQLLKGRVLKWSGVNCWRLLCQLVLGTEQRHESEYGRGRGGAGGERDRRRPMKIDRLDIKGKRVENWFIHGICW